MPSLNLSASLSSVSLFYSNTRTFLWNSYSHIPKPLNLVPNLPCPQPSPYVLTLPNIHALTTHTNYTNCARTNGVRGSKRWEGRAHAFVLAWTLSVSGGIKSRGCGWLSNLVGHSNGKPHYCTLISIDSCSHCLGINWVHEWPQTQDSSSTRLLCMCI